jgi:hypothetical protein
VRTGLRGWVCLEAGVGCPGVHVRRTACKTRMVWVAKRTLRWIDKVSGGEGSADLVHMCLVAHELPQRPTEAIFKEAYR